MGLRKAAALHATCLTFIRILYVFSMLFSKILRPGFELHRTQWNFEFRIALFFREFVAHLHVYLTAVRGVGKMLARVLFCAHMSRKKPRNMY